jgi:hypothetical protein
MMVDSWSNTDASVEKPVRIPSSKLFGDLVVYLVEVFDRRRTPIEDQRIRPYRYVETFCDHNGLNKDLVCELLKDHGADNDLEVLLNCLSAIPPYRSLSGSRETLHNQAENAAIAVQGG